MRLEVVWTRTAVSTQAETLSRRWSPTTTTNIPRHTPRRTTSKNFVRLRCTERHHQACVLQMKSSSSLWIVFVNHKTCMHLWNHRSPALDSAKSYPSSLLLLKLNSSLYLPSMRRRTLLATSDSWLISTARSANWPKTARIKFRWIKARVAWPRPNVSWRSWTWAGTRLVDWSRDATRNSHLEISATRRTEHITWVINYYS